MKQNVKWNPNEWVQIKMSPKILKLEISKSGETSNNIIYAFP